MSELPAAGNSPAQTALAELRRHAAYELVPSPDRVPLYDLVRVHGPDGEPLSFYRGVRRQDTHEVVSIVSSKYQLVQHRSIAEAVHAIGEALDQPDTTNAPHPLPREQIKLYHGGRRMEVKLVVGREFKVGGRDPVYPGIRVLNSVDSSWAITASAYSLRLACCNQLYAGLSDAVVELRELHLASATDLMGQLQRAIHEILDHFGEATEVYSRAMREEVLAGEVERALVAQGLPQVHAGAIGARAEAEASHNGLMSRWSAYQVATAYLTREVEVNPDRERMFERAAASALLLPTQEAAPA